ncbi:hypothetical protein GCM10027035_47590 [Emticicia sediminis]
MSSKPESKRVRELRGTMSLKVFCEPIGVSQANISNVENGAGLSVELAKKICDAYNVSMDWLYGRTDERQPVSPISIKEDTTVDYKTKYIEALEKINALQAEKLTKSEIRQTTLEK